VDFGLTLVVLSVLRVITESVLTTFTPILPNCERVLLMHLEASRALLREKKKSFNAIYRI
jgi:hypothetical protein